MRYLVIAYNPKTADGGRPIDLYDYLRTELDGVGIRVHLSETDPVCTCDDRSWRGKIHDTECQLTGARR